MAEGVAAVVYSTSLRNKLRRHSIRQRLRVATRQDGGAGDVPIARLGRVGHDKRQESPISDDESGDEGDSGSAQPTRPVDRPAAGGFFTIVPAVSSTKAAGSSGFSTIQRPRPRPTDDGATESDPVVNPRPNPSTLVSSTTRNPDPPPRPTAPSEKNRDVGPAPDPTDRSSTAEGPAAGRPTSNIPAGDAEMSSSSSIMPTDAAEPSVSMIPGDAEGLESNESAGRRLRPGVEAGIVLGALALTSLLIAIGFFFYRRRLNAKKRDVDVPPPPPPWSEKPFPPVPPHAQNMFSPLPPPGGAPRDLEFNSWANYQPPPRENGGQEQPIRAEYYGAEEEQGARRTMTVPGFIPAQPPLQPQPPPMAYMAEEPSREMVRSPQTAGGLVPPSHRPPHRGGSYSIYPRGHVTNGNYRPAVSK